MMYNNNQQSAAVDKEITLLPNITLLIFYHSETEDLKSYTTDQNQPQEEQRITIKGIGTHARNKHRNHMAHNNSPPNLNDSQKGAVVRFECMQITAHCPCSFC